MKLTLKGGWVAGELELEFNYMRLIMGQETVLLFENESSINICGTGCAWSDPLKAEELVCWPGTEKESKAVPQRIRRYV